IKVRRPLHGERFVRSFGVELLDEGIEACLLLQAVEPRRPGRLFLQGQMHALMTAILLRMARLDALDRDAEPGHQTESFDRLNSPLGLANGTPLSERIASGSPRSANSRSKAVIAGSSRVDSRASHSSRNREA